MPGLFDKLGKAAQQTAAAAQQKAAEGRIALDIRNLGSKLDERAQALGHLMFRQHRGETIPEQEYVKLLDEMAQIESERQAKEVELEDLHRPAEAAPGVAPSPAPSAVSRGTAFCSGCGTAINPGAKFCPSCGQPVSAA